MKNQVLESNRIENGSASQCHHNQNLLNLVRDIQDQLKQANSKLESTPSTSLLNHEAQDITGLWLRSANKNSSLTRELTRPLAVVLSRLDNETKRQGVSNDKDVNELQQTINVFLDEIQTILEREQQRDFGAESSSSSSRLPRRESQSLQDEIRSLIARELNQLKDRVLRDLLQSPRSSDQLQEKNQRDQLRRELELAELELHHERNLRIQVRCEQELRNEEKRERYRREHANKEKELREEILKEREIRHHERRERYRREEERREKNRQEEERHERDQRESDRLEREKRQDEFDARIGREEIYLEKQRRQDENQEQFRREDELHDRHLRLEALRERNQRIEELLLQHRARIRLENKSSQLRQTADDLATKFSDRLMANKLDQLLAEKNVQSEHSPYEVAKM